MKFEIRPYSIFNKGIIQLKYLHKKYIPVLIKISFNTD